MKKYYLKSNGKRVNIGDTISVKTKVQTEYGECCTELSVLVTEEVIPKLIKNKIIREVTSIPTDVTFYVKRLAKLWDLSYEDTDAMMETITETMPSVGIQIMCKLISEYVTEDKEMKDYSTIYGISLFDGKVFALPNTNTKGSEVVAWFPSRKTAEIAVDILKPLLEEIYGEQKD